MRSEKRVFRLFIIATDFREELSLSRVATRTTSSTGERRLDLGIGAGSRVISNRAFYTGLPGILTRRAGWFSSAPIATAWPRAPAGKWYEVAAVSLAGRTSLDNWRGSESPTSTRIFARHWWALSSVASFREGSGHVFAAWYRETMASRYRSSPSRRERSMCGKYQTLIGNYLNG